MSFLLPVDATHSSARDLVVVSERLNDRQEPRPVWSRGRR
jgi:hypothetical protein